MRVLSARGVLLLLETFDDKPRNLESGYYVVEGALRLICSVLLLPRANLPDLTSLILTLNADNVTEACTTKTP